MTSDYQLVKLPNQLIKNSIAPFNRQLVQIKEREIFLLANLSVSQSLKKCKQKKTKLLVGGSIAEHKGGEGWNYSIQLLVQSYLEDQCLEYMVIKVPQQSWHIDTGQATRYIRGLGTKWRSKLQLGEDKNDQLWLKYHNHTKRFKQSTVPP